MNLNIVKVQLGRMPCAFSSILFQTSYQEKCMTNSYIGVKKVYDLIVDLLSTLWRHGFSVTALGTAVFVLLKQKKIKKKLLSYIPWLLEEDSEVKPYIENQKIIMENQKRIMEGMGLEWVAPIYSTNSKDSVMKNEKLSRWHSITKWLAHRAKQFTKFGGMKMKNYLKKLGSRKFQSLLLSLIINGVSAYLFFTGTVEIDAVLDAYMPMINLIVGTISTWLYIWVEGKIDASHQYPNVSQDTIDYTQDTGV